MNEAMVSSPKPSLFPAATDISYVVYGVRLLDIICGNIRVFPFFSLMKNPERTATRPLSCHSEDRKCSRDLSGVCQLTSLSWFTSYKGWKKTQIAEVN
jgi:hypothetical protein